MPTTAMNMFRPTEFMNHTVELTGSGRKVGCTERSQPKTGRGSARARGRKRERNAADLEHERADQRTERNRRRR